MTTTNIASVAGDIRKRLPCVDVLTDAARMAPFASDRALFVPAGQPSAVVFPTTTAEVSQLCEIASAHNVPIVPRGAGTGYAGGAAALDGCLVVSLERMNRVLEVDEANAVAVVQPGVLNRDLSRAVQKVGLFFPPDPGSDDIATIGGNVATDAGGLCCVKYGVTHDYVIGLEVVLADGRTTRIGRRTRKGVAGLDLTSLFVGSEGILGIVTEVTLRLLRATGETCSTFVAEFSTLERAGAAVTSIMRSCVPSMLEIMDGAAVQALRAVRSLPFTPGAAAVLIGQADSADAAVRARDVDIMEELALAAGATSASRTDDLADGAELVAIRRLAGPAMEKLGTLLVGDVAVPVSRLAEFLSQVVEIARRSGVHIAVIGHAGDGNMHPSVIFDAADHAAAVAAHGAYREIVQFGLHLGGTITGEHGIGVAKIDLLPIEQSAVALDMQRAVKRALDPKGIMNPGRVFSLR